MAEENESWLSQNAGGIIGGVGAVMGALDIGGKKRRRNQVEQQKKLNDVNAATSKELADYEQGLKMKMWNDTNYTAQLKHAEKAGVSKVAAIGGSGTGTQGASVSGVSGGGGAEDASSQLQASNGRIMAGMQLAQLNLLNAQKENIEADTVNKIKGAGKSASETTGQDIENEIQGDTKERQKEKIGSEADYQFEQAEMATVERQLQYTTQQDVRDGIKADAIGKVLANKLITAQTGKTHAEVRKIGNEIAQKWEEVAQGWEKNKQGWSGLDKTQQQIELDKFKKIIEAQYPAVWQVMGRAMDDVIQDVMNLDGKGRRINKTPKTVNNK